MSEQETEQERRKRREDEAVIAAKNMLDKIKDELSSTQEIISSGVKEIIEKQSKDPGDILGIKAVVSERKALEALKKQEYDKLVNKEYMKTLDKDYDEVLEDMWENRY